MTIGIIGLGYVGEPPHLGPASLNLDEAVAIAHEIPIVDLRGVTRHGNPAQASVINKGKES